MICRLVEGAFIPGHATHYIGVGGVVINEREELLVVCERHRRTAQPYYKLPGGALQPGEHLVDAVLREVLEETGCQREVRGAGVFSALARLPLRQVRHLLRVSAVAAEPGPDDAGRGDRRVLLDAGGRLLRVRPGERVQQAHRARGLAGRGSRPSGSTATATRPATSSSCHHWNEPVKLPVQPPIAPMLAELARELPSGDGWLYEPKWDGFRASCSGTAPDPLYPEPRPEARSAATFRSSRRAYSDALPAPWCSTAKCVIATDQGLDFEALGQRIHPAESRIKLLARRDSCRRSSLSTCSQRWRRAI